MICVEKNSKIHFLIVAKNVIMMNAQNVIPVEEKADVRLGDS